MRSYLRAGFVAVSAAAITAILSASLVSAAAPEVTCKSRKLSATGKLVSSLVGCDSKATKRGEPIDGACQAKALEKYAAAFAKAEADTACNGTQAVDEQVAGGLAAAVHVDLAGSGPPAASDCTAAKLKAAGKHASQIFKIEASRVRGTDAAKLAELAAKASGKLTSAFAKADEKDDPCLRTTDAPTIVETVDDGVTEVVSCIAAAEVCSEVSEGVAGGGTSTTDPSSAGATAADPVTTSVTSPNAGTVTIRETDPPAPAPAGYALVGQRVDVTAPAATAAVPLQLRFELYAGILPADPMAVEVTRNGELVADCTGAPGQASPDPCVESRTVLPSLNLRIDVLTSAASDWQFIHALPGFETRCPDTLETRLLAQTRGTCGSNADCAFGTCNATIGRCQTRSELDVGWTGISHDFDIVDDVVVLYDLSCPNLDGDSICGECDVTGINPAPGNCRCANNNLVSCDEPFIADADDCGGSICNCYLGPPLPLSGGNTPACIVNKLASDVAGTQNVDTGDSALALSLSAVVHLGIALAQPCPFCSGDTAPNDGQREGVCVGGANDGIACDSGGIDTSFPAPGGGGHSLDCLPSSGVNVTGPGLKISLAQTSGTMALAPTVPCAPSNALLCPCGKCSNDATIPCHVNADCPVGGTCQPRNQLEPLPNQCDDLGCVDAGNDEGECNSGPSDLGCDGILRANGEFFIYCLNNADCDPSNIGIEAGNCTLGQVRECFQNTISATGDPDPIEPVRVATFCAAATANAGVNAVSGLPGPARVRIASSDVARCEGDEYVPSFGCEPVPVCAFANKWGSLGSAAGQFNKPPGIATDVSGNVYLADQLNHRIQKFTSAGVFVTQWGTSGSADGQFQNPIGIAVDQNGFVYVNDLGNFRIQKFTDTGVFVTKWGSAGSGDGQINNAFGIAVDNAGFVYVADRVNQRIQKFTDTGVFVTKWGALGSGDGQFNNPYGVTADGNGNVYVADASNHRIQKFTDTGTFLAKWGTFGSSAGQLNGPTGVTTDAAGNVYVADRENDRIQKFDSSGAFLTRFGQTGTADGQFTRPTDVAVSGGGTVYVADQYNDRVQAFVCP